MNFNIFIENNDLVDQQAKKDQIDYEISQCLKENEYDRVVEIYENKLEVFQKQERKASRNQMLRRIVRKLKIRKN